MIAAFLLLVRQTWRAWLLALPYQAAIGLAIGLLLAPVATTPLIDPATGTPNAALMGNMGGVLFLVCLLIVLAAHFSRADSHSLSPFSHLWSLLWRAGAGFLGFVLLTGSPLLANVAGVAGPFGLAMAMGLVSVAAFWLMDSTTRVGDPPPPPRPRPEGGFVIALLKVLGTDLLRLYRGIKGLWWRIPGSLAAATFAMFVLSFAAMPISFVVSTVAPWLPLWAAVVIATAGGSIIPTAAAAALRPDRAPPTLHGGTGLPEGETGQSDATSPAPTTGADGAPPATGAANDPMPPTTTPKGTRRRAT